VAAAPSQWIQSAIRHITIEEFLALEATSMKLAASSEGNVD
jgi:hypothetical protein